MPSSPPTSSTESSFSHYAPISPNRTDNDNTPTRPLDDAVQRSRLRESRRNKRLLVARRINRTTRRLPRPKHPPSHLVPLQNALSAQALHHLQSLPPHQRTAERYITALHHLDTIRPIAARHFDAVAHALVIHPVELRRLFALHTFATAARPKPTLHPSLSFRRIIAGHVAQPVLHLAPHKTHSYLPSKSAHRFVNTPSMKGAIVREARDALSAAAWEGMARRYAVVRMLNGKERAAILGEERMYVDCDSDDSGEEGHICDEYFRAVSELPDTDAVPRNILEQVARKVEDLATILRQAPCTMRVEDAFEIVRKSARFERERGGRALMRRHRVGGTWLMSGPGRNAYGVWNLPDGPSRLAYRMALFRTEAMKWIAKWNIEHNWDDKPHFRRILREDVFARAGLNLHPFVERLFMGVFSSVEDIAEDLSRLGHFRELMGMDGRLEILRVVADMQMTALLEVMVHENQEVAQELICRFRSVRRVVRCSLDELEWAYGDQDEAHRVSQLLHGYHRAYFAVLMGRVKLPYLVGRTLHAEMGDVYNYREAAFSAAMGKIRAVSDADETLKKTRQVALTEDERIAAYETLHANEEVHSRTAWERFEASWGVFRLVCGFVGVEDAVDVTCRLLDEDGTGGGVLRRIRNESVERICASESELCADDAVRLKIFASNFVLSH